MIKKIISGAQTGADLAGLMAAKRYGIETGGTMPKGFLTQAGPKPEWAKEYNLKESFSAKYPPRTRQNVADSDATLRFAADFNSAGERCTLNAIHELKKPYLDINIFKVPPVEQVIVWLEKYNVSVLNIAGNSERTFEGMTGEVLEYLCKLFEKIGFKEQ